MIDSAMNPPSVDRARVPKLALTIAECADAIGLSPRTVEELIRVRELRPVRVGRRVLVSVRELHRFLRERTEGGDDDRA